MAFIIRPEHVEEVLDRLTGIWHAKTSQPDAVGPQDYM